MKNLELEKLCDIYFPSGSNPETLSRWCLDRFDAVHETPGDPFWEAYKTVKPVSAGPHDKKQCGSPK
jgi:hypothetical protein